MDSDQRSASVVVLTVNDVYDMYPDKHGRGGTQLLLAFSYLFSNDPVLVTIIIGAAEFATLLERERAAVPPTSTLLVTLNGDFLSGSQIGARCKGYELFVALVHNDS